MFCKGLALSPTQCTAAAMSKSVASGVSNVYVCVLVSYVNTKRTFSVNPEIEDTIGPGVPGLPRTVPSEKHHHMDKLWTMYVYISSEYLLIVEEL